MPGVLRAPRASAGASTAQRRVELPTYEPRAYPLTAKAQQELITLVNKHSLKKLDELLADSTTHLQSNIAGINDTYYKQESDLESRKRKLADTDEDEQASIDQLQADLDELKGKVEEMSSRMDDNMRKTIDSQQVVAHIREALTTVSRDAARTAASASTATQQSTTRSRRMPGALESDDEGEPPATFTPTEAGQTQDMPQPWASGPGLHEMFAEQLAKRKDRYESYTRRQRYGNNNGYKNFRRMLHDAQHQDDDIPMPHENTWFPEETAPAPGVTTGRGGRGRNAQPQDDSDDDLAVARETISTKCPLTLRDYSDPVTSRKCPHSFEREAIQELIDGSTYSLTPSIIPDSNNTPVELDGLASTLQSQVPAGSQLVNTQAAGHGGGRGGRAGAAAAGVKAVQCPVPGCSSLLTSADLFVDPVLKRKIERLLRAQRELEEGSSGDEAVRRRRGGKSVVSVESGDEIEDDDEDETPVGGRTGTARRRLVKGERAGSDEL